MGIQPPKLKVALRAGHEEGKTLGQEIQPREVEIPAIHDVKGTGFRKDLVQDVDIVHLAVADPDECRDVAPEIEQGVELDGCLRLAEVSPREHGKTQIDRRGIEGIDGLVQFDPEIVLGVQTSGDLDQDLSDIGIDPPVSCLVGVRERASGHVGANPHVIQFALLCPKTGFDVPQAFPIRELGKSH